MLVFITISALLVCATALPSFRLNSMERQERRVPVDLFVMSKCPDAVYCESVFSSVLKNVKAEVSLDINYIAQYDGSEPFGHSCKHGDSECLGNIQQLCFRHEYPNRNDWFAFNLCLNRRYNQIGLNNSLAEDCARTLRKSYTPVQNCTHSGLGVGLLTESAQKTKKLGVRSSCTIFIDNKLRCVHDGTWRDCPGGSKVEDFVQTIEDAYYSTRSYYK